jgi:hypothetical protein
MGSRTPILRDACDTYGTRSKVCQKQPDLVLKLLNDQCRQRCFALLSY